MEYQEEFILDFACRTRANLIYIEAAERRGDNVFEFTQLANSLLGLLIFPRERYVAQIPATPLTELVRQGWPNIRTTHGQLAQDNLQELVRMLRNSIAHCNVEFIGKAGTITGIKVWNFSHGKLTWKGELSIQDLRAFAIKFVDLIEASQGPSSDEPRGSRDSLQ